MTELKRLQKALLKMMSKLEITSNGCWVYTGYKNRRGYGRFRANGEKILAHRFSYQMNIGSIPENMLVLHKCDNPSCVNPEHLYLGKNKENAGDMASRNRQWLQRAKEQGLKFCIRKGALPDGYESIR